MAPTVEFHTGGASSESYTGFINNVREAVLISGKKSHGIPVLPQESSLTEKNEFLLVVLTNDETQFSITVAVSAATLNVVAYEHGESTGPGRSFFLRDAPPDAAILLFTGTLKSPLPDVSSGYKLVDRSDLGLGIEPLKGAINELRRFTDPTKVTDGFRKSLAVVQEMVSEAARFYSIQYEIAGKLSPNYYPQYDAISYEDNWRALSEAIQGADPSGKFPQPVTLMYANHEPRVVTNVDQVKADIALLVYYPN